MAMFNRDEGDAHSVETIIGPSVKVEGNFVGSGNVAVEGVVNGSIKTSKDLRIGDRAKVKADIDAANVVIAGEVHGNIKAGGRLELMPSAKVFGNVETATLSVAQGAILNGKCLMVKNDIGSVAPLVSEKNEKIDKKRTA
ncbi:MAG: polymer-forming cytoskeletal protein [Candidatus Kerfeldbacteria bacterium]